MAAMTNVWTSHIDLQMILLQQKKSKKKYLLKLKKLLFILSCSENLIRSILMTLTIFYGSTYHLYVFIYSVYRYILLTVNL